MDSKEIKEHTSKGYIHANIMLELIGNPKEHIDKTLKLLVDQLKNDKNMIWLKEDIGEAEETSDGLWGAFCEAEILAKDIMTLTSLAINYAPASIDILGPESITIKEKQLTDIFGDLLSQIHNVNTKLIDISSQNKAYEKSMNALVRNAILVGLGTKEMKPEEIGKIIGVAAKDIEPVLEAMIKEKKLQKNGENYKRL